MNMPETTVPITENEAVKNIIMLLQGKGTEQEKQDIESLVSHIESMETQFAKVFDELQDVKSQLKAIEDKSVRAAVQRIVDNVELKVNDVKDQFVSLKDSVVNSFSDAAEAIKQKGVSALRKTVDFLKIHTALSHLKNKLNQSVHSLNQGAEQIQTIKNELYTAKEHFTNATHLAVGKSTKEVSPNNSERGVLTKIQRLMLKAGGLLKGMSKTADSAISKLEKLEQKDEKMSVRDSLKDIKRSRSNTHSTTEKVSPDKTR